MRLAPEIFFMLPTVKYLGHEIGFNSNKAIHFQNAVVHKIPRPTTNNELLRFIGSMNFNSQFNDDMVRWRFCMIRMIIVNFTGVLNWKHCFNNL